MGQEIRQSSSGKFLGATMCPLESAAQLYSFGGWAGMRDAKRLQLQVWYLSVPSVWPLLTHSLSPHPANAPTCHMTMWGFLIAQWSQELFSSRAVAFRKELLLGVEADAEYLQGPVLENITAPLSATVLLIRTDH